jgi:hypothetical protein
LLDVSINEISFGKVTFQCIIDILDTCQGKGLAEEGDISCFQAPLGTFKNLEKTMVVSVKVIEINYKKETTILNNLFIMNA